MTGFLLMGGCAGPGYGIKGNPRAVSTEEERDIRSEFGPKRLALVMGVNSFLDPQWHPLRFAVKDAKDMANALSHSTMGKFDEVRILTTPSETTRSSILEAIDQLALKNLSEEDTIVLYISSHGTLAQDEEGFWRQYLVASDTSMEEIRRTAIDLSRLKADFGRLKSRKKVLIFAFCHSGQGKSGFDTATQSALRRIKSPFFIKPLETVSEASIILAASSWGETALEDETLKNDIYTHFLIEAIKSQDQNGDGAVTVTEAHEYAREKTYLYSRSRQRPSLEGFFIGGDPIILSGEIVRKGKPFLYDYSSRFRNMDLRIDGVKKGALPMGVAIEPGVHRVALFGKGNSEAFYDEFIRVREGDVISIPNLVNGYNRGISARLGYSAFVDDQVNKSVANPLVTYGLTYQHQRPDSNWGFRGELSYGAGEQTLEVDFEDMVADVSQLNLGAALVYIRQGRWLSWFGGPRIGGLYMTRDLKQEDFHKEYVATPIPGGFLGVALHDRRRLSAMMEGSLNYTNLNFNGAHTASLYYHLSFGLSVNF